MVKWLSTSFQCGLLLFICSCAQLKEPNDHSDHNGDPALAVDIPSSPATLSEYIDNPGDEDYFKTLVAADKRIKIDLSVPAGQDYDLYLLNSNEVVIESSIKSIPGGMESIQHTSSQSEVYYIRINSKVGSFSAVERYRVTVYVTDTAGTSGYSSPHLVLGNPSNAAAIPDSTKNFLMEKSQYALSYNRSMGRPNWVSWQLNSAWLGNVPRQDDFRADASLPPNWYQVTDNDFSGSGYDRGHMCPSGDRTATESDNSETFLMTNMIAQAPDNNQGPWANFESYCRDLAAEGNELFITSGGYGVNDVIATGHVSVPARTWKIVVVLNESGIGLAGVTSSTRVIAVDMPNSDGIRNANWKNYRVSVDAVESVTGYDFMSNVPVPIQTTIESVVDNQ